MGFYLFIALELFQRCCCVLCCWMRSMWPHTDLTITRGKWWNPRGGEGSPLCEKSKWEVKVMDSLWRLCVFVSFRTAPRGQREKARSFVSDLNGRVWTSCGCRNEPIFVPRGWTWTATKAGANERLKKWELNKCITQSGTREVERSPWSPHLAAF